jgi:predicted Zn-dependent peptidase
LTEISRLPSGLTVVTEMRTDVETVALGVFVNAGTRDEQPNEHGLAHFLEHMAFKGTKRRSAYQTVADIEALGGDINAETSPETTSYTVRMLADDWRAGLDVLLDIVCAPNFRDADIALEKDVVVQEIAGAMDVPDDRLVDGIGLATFDSHPIGQPILGTDSTVRSLDADALRTFRARTYAPQSVVISAAGAIKHDDLVRALEEGEPPLPSSAPANRSAPQFGAGRFFEARQTFDTHLALAWEAPPFAAPGAMPHAFAVQMLGGGMTSRLFQAIREEAGLAYAADAYQMIYSDTGLGVIQTATSADTVAPMIERLETSCCGSPTLCAPTNFRLQNASFVLHWQWRRKTCLPLPRGTPDRSAYSVTFEPGRGSKARSRPQPWRTFEAVGRTSCSAAPSPKLLLAMPKLLTFGPIGRWYRQRPWSKSWLSSTNISTARDLLSLFVASFAASLRERTLPRPRARRG